MAYSYVFEVPYCLKCVIQIQSKLRAPSKSWKFLLDWLVWYSEVNLSNARDSTCLCKLKLLLSYKDTLQMQGPGGRPRRRPNGKTKWLSVRRSCVNIIRTRRTRSAVSSPTQPGISSSCSVFWSQACWSTHKSKLVALPLVHCISKGVQSMATETKIYEYEASWLLLAVLREWRSKPRPFTKQELDMYSSVLEAVQTAHGENEIFWTSDGLQACKILARKCSCSLQNGKCLKHLACLLGCLLRKKLLADTVKESWERVLDIKWILQDLAWTPSIELISLTKVDLFSPLCLQAHLIHLLRRALVQWQDFPWIMMTNLPYIKSDSLEMKSLQILCLIPSTSIALDT